MIERRLQPSPWVEYRRRIVNALGHGVVALASVVVLFPLIAVIWYTLREGIPGLTWDFFTQLPKPVGEVGGGMANAIVGSGIVVGLASLVAIPLGILAGIFISEYASARLAAAIRFVTEVMLGLPSILLGIFAYAVVVKPIGHFSAYAGAAALAIVMLPIVIKTTEEILRLVPRHIREAGLALGIPQWVVVLRIILRAASRGIVTGILLAVARAAGETAPLALYSAQQPILAYHTRPTHCNAPGADFYVRRRTLRGLASPSVGRGTRAHRAGACTQHRLAAGSFANPL